MDLIGRAAASSQPYNENKYAEYDFCIATQNSAATTTTSVHTATLEETDAVGDTQTSHAD